MQKYFSKNLATETQNEIIKSVIVRLVIQLYDTRNKHTAKITKDAITNIKKEYADIGWKLKKKASPSSKIAI